MVIKAYTYQVEVARVVKIYDAYFAHLLIPLIFL
jgi:hypothetical protein